MNDRITVMDREQVSQFVMKYKNPEIVTIANGGISRKFYLNGEFLCQAESLKIKVCSVKACEVFSIKDEGEKFYSYEYTFEKDGNLIIAAYKETIVVSFVYEKEGSDSTVRSIINEIEFQDPKDRKYEFSRRHLNDRKPANLYHKKEWEKLEKYLSSSDDYEKKDEDESSYNMNWISFFENTPSYQGCTHTLCPFPFFDIRNVLPSNDGICAVKEKDRDERYAIVNEHCRVPLTIQTKYKEKFPTRIEDSDYLKEVFTAVKLCIETVINQGKRKNREYVITIHGISETRMEIYGYMPKFYSYSVFMGFDYFGNNRRRDMEVINGQKLLEEFKETIQGE